MKFLLCLVPLVFAAGQASSQPPLIRVDVKLVRLLVSVKNPQGELVGSLDPKEFSVFDCGVPQEIAVFERQTIQPLWVSVLLDASGSTIKDLPYEVNSVGKFYKALFREGNPKDVAALYSFNYEVTLQSSFTRNLARLQEALKKIHATAGTSLYDAMHYAGRDLQGREGRHVMIIVSDGGDTTSHYDFHHALESAQRADAVVYAIITVPIENGAGRNIGGENALKQFASGTGGRVFYPSSYAELDSNFSEILNDLRTQYLLGYYPRNLPKDAPKFRPVHVDVKRPDLRASTRSGYYGETVP